MTTIKSLKDKANELRKQKRYNESLPLYEKMWLEHRPKCGCWEGWGYATCLRKSGDVVKALKICREIYKTDPSFKLGNDLYSWCIYDLHVRKPNEDIGKDEKEFFKAVNAIISLVKQGEYTPFTKTILKVASYLNSKQSVNYENIASWLNKVSPDDLSHETLSYEESEGKKREVIPDKEKWYSFMTMALFKLKRFNDCKEVCNKALINISNFHFSNDIWIKRRLALAKRNTGDVNTAIEIYNQIIEFKKEWYIQYELSKLHYNQGHIKEALEQAIDAALNKGKIEYKWKLFVHLGEILKKEGKKEYAVMHFELANTIIKHQGWKSNLILDSVMKEINEDNILDQVKLKTNLKEFWEDVKYKNSIRSEGQIIKILSHGKSGFIKTNSGDNYYFGFNNFKDDKNKVKIGQHVFFHIVESYDKKKKRKSHEAVNIKIKSSN